MKIRASILTNLLLLLLFLLPLQTRWIISRAPLGTGTSEYGTVSIWAAELLFWVTFVLFLFSGRLKAPREASGKRTIFLALALLIYSVLGIFINPSPLRGFFSWIRILDGFLLFVLLAQGGVKNNRLVYSFIMGAALQAVIGIVQFSVQGISPSTLFGVAIHDPGFLGDAVVETTSGRWLRAYGGLPHPNILGGYLAVALIFLGTLAVWGRKRAKADTAILFGLLLISAGLFFTFSRGAWIAFAAGGIIFIWNAFLKNGDERFHKFIRFGLPIALLWLVLGLTFVPLLQSRFGSLIPSPEIKNRLEERSQRERVDEYSLAAELFPSYFLSGTGIGAYSQRLAERAPGLPGYAYQPVHNAYLLLGLELGLPALFLFAAMLLIFISGIKESNRWAVYPPFIALLSLGFFDHYLWSLESGVMLFWVTLGLLYNFRAEESSI